MKNKVVRNILIAILIVFTVISIGLFGYRLGQKNSTVYLLGSKNLSGLDKLRATLQLIEENYVDSVSTDSLVQNLIPMLMSNLDPHSSYLTAKEREKEREQMEGFFYGIGVTFNTLKDTLVVISTVPNGPSDVAGIHAGDRITHVDGRSIEGNTISADTIKSLLKGANHSLVKLKVRDPKNGKIEDVQVKRGTVNINQVSASYLTEDSLGVIQLNTFSNNSHKDFMQSFARLQQNGMKGLVIDLRDNPGGSMQTALLIANELLPKNELIIYTEGRHSPREEFRSDGRGNLVNFPTYVLVNENSASASEILSGAVQDNDAGIVIGRRTFGKGLVQKVFEYNDHSSVHLTISRYYTPSGRSIQREYKLGNNRKYAQDWMARLNNGELFHKDSISLDKSLLFTTRGGRPVYGGGGITPDIFVPRDTTGFNSYVIEVFEKGIMQEFTFLYADRHRELLTKLGSADKAYAFLKNQGMVWQMANFGTQKGVRIKNYLVFKSEKMLEGFVIPMVIDYIYGKDESARIAALYDPMMQTANKLFKSGVKSPFEILEERKALPDSVLLIQ